MEIYFTWTWIMDSLVYIIQLQQIMTVSLFIFENSSHECGVTLKSKKTEHPDVIILQ